MGTPSVACDGGSDRAGLQPAGLERHSPPHRAHRTPAGSSPPARTATDTQLQSLPPSRRSSRLGPAPCAPTRFSSQPRVTPRASCREAQQFSHLEAESELAWPSPRGRKRVCRPLTHLYWATASRTEESSSARSIWQRGGSRSGPGRVLLPVCLMLSEGEAARRGWAHTLLPL